MLHYRVSAFFAFTCTPFHPQPMKLFFTVFFLTLFPVYSWAQLHCGTVNIEPNTPVNANFTFDSFTDYEGGITINNVATIRVKVEHQAIPDLDCKWFLYMQVNNNPGSGTAAPNWEKLSNYGSTGGSEPSIDILEIKVRNNCQTSPIDGIYQSFTTNGDVIDIIADLLPLTAAGACAANTNGPGSFLTNYDEYTFTVDIRVAPGYTFNPGIYELDILFHLEEQL